MGNTTIRSSTQLFIDDNLDMKNKKGVNLSPGTQAGDAVEFTQMNTAIDNALSGAGNSIHVPVADLAASKAVPLSERADKMLMLIETLGLYRYDAQMIDVSNDTTIIRPTDIASDAVAGRWIKISSTITDHDNLSNILGNGTYHLSLTERDKLTGIQDGADVTSATNVGNVINSATAKATLVDADMVGVMDSASGNILRKWSWANIKTQLFGLFSGEVSSTAEGSITLLNSAVIGKVLTGFTGTAGTVSAADSIVSAFNKVVGNINALGAASVATLANALVKRDANGNIFTDNTIHGYQSTATASGTTTITANSARNQYFTGSLNQTLVLPVVTTLSLGFEYVVKNLSSGNITVQSSGLNTIKVIPPGGVAKFICITITGTGTSSWDMDYTPIRIFRASLTGTINGSNTTFTVSALILSGTEEVIKNGYILNVGAGNDYTITYGATTTITFATAPSATGFTDVLMINYSL